MRKKRFFLFLLISFTCVIFASILMVWELWKNTNFQSRWNISYSLRGFSGTELFPLTHWRHCFREQKIYLFSMALHYLASLKDPVQELVASDSNSSCCSPDERSDCGSRICDTMLAQIPLLLCGNQLHSFACYSDNLRLLVS